MPKEKNRLETEISYFEENKKYYLKHYPKQFVLIKDKSFAGSFTNEVDAYKEGIQKFGNTPFLIKQVLPQEDNATFSSLLFG